MKIKDIGLFFAGAAVGAGLTWLFTTDDGKELLDKLKEKAVDFKDELDDSLENIKQAFDDSNNTESNKS